MKKKILITGGQGFVGSFLVDNFLSKGHEVTIFDRHYDSAKFKEYNWEGKVIFQLGDLKDRDSVIEAVSLNDIVVNLAGLLGTQEMMNNPIPAIEVNILGAINVFDACRMHKKRGFQVAVGNFWMNNPYSITKSVTERFALMYNKEHKTDIRICRGMNIYGPRQKHRPIRKIFPNLVIPALLNEDITIYGTGEQVMDLLYVKDFAEILSKIILTDNIPGDVIFEAGAGEFTINNAVNKVLELTQSKSKVNRIPMRPGEDAMSVVKISDEGWANLKKYINYTPADLTPMHIAMKQSIDWYRDNLSRFPWD
ncbi:TPA: hypothetical protein DIU22_04915 [Candidatus Woesebacteria bacterium]|nr:hypothetical protein [Candidatus Woesebacteria bacterium]